MEHNTDVRQAPLNRHVFSRLLLISPLLVRGRAARRWFSFFSELCVAVSRIKMILFPHCSDVAVLYLCQFHSSQQKVDQGEGWGGGDGVIINVSVFCERFSTICRATKTKCCCGPSKQGYTQGMLKIALPKSLYSAS